jgi:hypothetical protein
VVLILIAFCGVCLILTLILFSSSSFQHCWLAPNRGYPTIDEFFGNQETHARVLCIRSFFDRGFGVVIDADADADDVDQLSIRVLQIGFVSEVCHFLMWMFVRVGWKQLRVEGFPPNDGYVRTSIHTHIHST